MSTDKHSPNREDRMKPSKNYNNNSIAASQIVGDSSIDEKIRQSVDYAARVRQSYRFIDKQTDNGRRADLPLPRHFKTKHENVNAKHGEVK